MRRILPTYEECAENCWCYMFSQQETAKLREELKKRDKYIKKQKNPFYRFKKWLNKYFKKISTR